MRDSTTGAIEHTESIDGCAPSCSIPAGGQAACDVIATADGGLIVVDTTDESILPTGACEIVQPGPASIGSPDSDTESKRMVSPQSVTSVEIVGDVVWVAGDSDSSPSVFGTTEWPLRSDVNATVTSRAMWLTARSRTDGSELMFHSFDSAGGDSGGGIAVDGDNRVWAVGGIGTGLTETTSEMRSGIVLADTSGVLHAEQFGGSDDDYAYDTAFTSDGTFVVTGAEGAGCDGATKSFVNVFVRTMTQAPPISTTTTTTTSAPSTPVAELR